MIHLFSVGKYYSISFSAPVWVRDFCLRRIEGVLRLHVLNHSLQLPVSLYIECSNQAHVVLPISLRYPPLEVPRRPGRLGRQDELRVVDGGLGALVQ